jgi:hypothetical protein
MALHSTRFFSDFGLLHRCRSYPIQAAGSAFMLNLIFAYYCTTRTALTVCAGPFLAAVYIVGSLVGSCSESRTALKMPE